MSIITNRRKNNRQSLYEGDFTALSGWIDFFLGRMRNDFPMTYLSHMSGEAATVRQANYMKDLGSFSPKHMGYLNINRYIINNLILANERNDEKSENLFRFQMIISIGHEIVHFLTGFLTGEKADKIGTPRETSAPWYGTRDYGEAGRFWEEKFFGGQMEMWEDKSDPLGALQAGKPYLMDDGNPKSRARAIDIDFINEFFSGKQRLPIRTQGRKRATTREALRKNCPYKVKV
ncbi:hypothetical protein Daus18300_008123 [Diaporthe australafricana]|uniref:SprT-like domain-containing protein n=1 Tax=Diaporthe australafricana TaxID=127596 RepID=A0ABR3WK93_9PEZI